MLLLYQFFCAAKTLADGRCRVELDKSAVSVGALDIEQPPVHLNEVWLIRCRWFAELRKDALVGSRTEVVNILSDDCEGRARSGSMSYVRNRELGQSDMCRVRFRFQSTTQSVTFLVSDTSIYDDFFGWDTDASLR